MDAGPPNVGRWWPWLRWLAVAAGAGFGLWLATGVTLTLVVGPLQPATALAIWPRGTISEAALSSQLLGASDWEGARIAAQTALEREPVNAEAVRTLGLVAARNGNQRQAARLFAYSEGLSRRDLPTQLWLIEASVQRNDIPGALRHYDRAMRASIASRAILIPILVTASAEPAIARELSRKLATRPEWGVEFMEALIDAQSTSPETLALVLRQLRIQPADNYSGFLSGGLNRLVATGAYAAAYDIYYDARGGAGRGTQLIRNGDFSLQNPIQPFDWWLRSEPGLAAVVEAREGMSVPSLSVVSEDGRTGDVARQFLYLPAGRYELSATVGDVPDEESSRPGISVTCLSGNALARARFAASIPGPAQMRLNFTVPATGCPAQWITIESPSNVTQSTNTRPWITSISMRRL